MKNKFSYFTLILTVALTASQEFVKDLSFSINKLSDCDNMGCASIPILGTEVETANYVE